MAESTNINPTQPSTLVHNPSPSPTIIFAKASTLNTPQEQQAPLALTTQPQNRPQLQTNAVPQQQPTQVVPQTSPPPTNHQVAQLPPKIQPNQLQPTPTITTHPTQPIALANTALVIRPPQTLPVVPITTTTTTTTTVSNVKQEPNSYVCCLLDNGLRCGRKAGNASFSARIQKIVGTKKMNFALDPNARHAYICDHHKAIITVAKKSANAAARETKTNARNYNNTNNNALAQRHNSFNELPINQAAVNHPINLGLLNNQGRLTNNHAGVLDGAQMHPSTQLGYGHHQGPLPDDHYQVGSMNQVAPMNFDNTGGGDSIPASSGGIDVDLQQLQVNTLRRYKRHFRVPTRPGLNKMQLAESLKNHFRTLPIIEKEAITYFVYIVKCSRNKLDFNSKADTTFARH